MTAPAHLAQEDLPGGPKVAVISDKFWQRHFNGAEGVVGTTLPLNGDQYTIIGGAVNLVYLGALLLWPSQDTDASLAEPSARTAPSAPRPSIPVPSARAPRREFGLRTR